MTVPFFNNQLRLYVDLEIIRNNYKNLCAWTKTPIAAVLKANAYGLGAVPIAKTLWHAGCRKFFLATIAEAIAIREALPEATIYLLHGVFKEEIEDLLAHNIIPVLNNLEQLEHWSNAAKKEGQKLPAILHFDTGMNRLGFDMQDVEHVQQKCGQLDLHYIMSHLACADSPENPYNAEQRQKLLKIAEHFPNTPKSLASSEGISLGSDYHFDLLRVGISCYGIIPYEPHTRFAVRPQAQIIQTRTLKAGDTIGYGKTYTAPNPRRVGTIALGFADGPLTRAGSNQGRVYIGDCEAPIVGRVSMDLTVIDLTHIPENIAHPTIWVDVFRDNMSHLKLANDCNIALYEITCRIGQRYQKIYKNVHDL